MFWVGWVCKSQIGIIGGDIQFLLVNN